MLLATLLTCGLVIVVVAMHLVPVGHLRILAAAESLLGIILVAWTASFSFFAMQRLWSESDGAAVPTR